ncbi:golgi membrane protein [Paraphaeosphaeria sporulosa]
MLFPNLSTAIMAVAAFTSTVDAFPQPPGATSLSTLAKKMPANTLPAPTGLELKYVLLGVGTQNYTCLTGNASDVPDTTGAAAKLYDLGTRLNNDPLAQWKIPAISGLALSLSAFGTWQLELYLMAEGYNQWLGNHFFTLNVPTFSLYKTKTTPHPLAMVSKKAEQDAPKTACQGTKCEGAVKWLYLADDAVPALSQGGVNTVYRLETAGGNKPATCQGRMKYFEVPYAAQYWVYGPKT